MRLEPHSQSAWALCALGLVFGAVGPARAQTAPRRAPEARSLPAPDVTREPAGAERTRPLEDRYGDALGGTWLGAALGSLGTGLVGAGIGAALGCSSGNPTFDWCSYLVFTMGLPSGLGAGYGMGTVVGVARGAGLYMGEAVLVSGLGLLSGGAFVGAGVGIAAALEGTVSGSGGLHGLIAGGVAGAVACLFLTPLYAVLLYPDRSSAPEPTLVSLTGWMAPAPRGLTAGVAGHF